MTNTGNILRGIMPENQGICVCYTYEYGYLLTMHVLHMCIKEYLYTRINEQHSQEHVL
jgi:hypothetical protein